MGGHIEVIEPPVGGDRRKPGPLTDRVLMRVKDAIIIGAAAFALVKWFIVNPIQVQDQVFRQEQIQVQQQKTLERIAESVQAQTAQLGVIERRFAEFQKSFYSKKPGGWVYEDDRWKWNQSGQ